MIAAKIQIGSKRGAVFLVQRHGTLGEANAPMAIFR